MAGKKRVDPIKQREKRAKIAAGVGCALLVAVGAYEVPSMLSVMNKKPPPGANATDAGNRNPDGSIPLPSVAVGSGLSGTGQLANTDVPPASDGSQLVVFSVFATKNPFTPQATTVVVATTGATAADKPGADVPPTTTSTTTTPTSTTPTTTTSSVVPAAPTTTTTPASSPTVAISVNGIVAHVGIQGTFPTGAPVFRLVSYTNDSAQVGIVGGSYASGSSTLTLQVHKPVTLQNTTDQTTYKLELITTH